MKSLWKRLLTGEDTRGEVPSGNVGGRPGRTQAGTATVARGRAEVHGIVHALLQRPTAGGGTELVARVSGRQGTVELVWLGRKTLSGVQQGTQLRAHGMLTTVRGRPTIFNPAYDLSPPAADAA